MHFISGWANSPNKFLCPLFSLQTHNQAKQPGTTLHVTHARRITFPRTLVFGSISRILWTTVLPLPILPHLFLPLKTWIRNCHSRSSFSLSTVCCSVIYLTEVFFRMKKGRAFPCGVVRGWENVWCEHNDGMIIALNKRDNNCNEHACAYFCFFPLDSKQGGIPFLWQYPSYIHFFQLYSRGKNRISADFTFFFQISIPLIPLWQLKLRHVVGTDR